MASTTSKIPKKSASARRGQSRRPSSRSAPAKSTPQSSSGRGTVARVALGTAAGAVAIGAAAAARRPRRRHVLGVTLPAAGKVNPAKLAKKVDPGKLVKQVGSAAEQIEARSDDVRMISGQVKRLTKKIS